MKETIQELADTTSSSVRGSSITKYALEPTRWLSEIMDAAKKKHIFMQAAYQTSAPKGHKDVVIPYKKWYLKNVGTFSDQTSEGSAITYTTMDNNEGLQLAPSPHSYGVALARYALNVNAVDLVKQAKDELIYNAGDIVDIAVATGLRDAGSATSSATGAQELFGGDASSPITLEAGDVLTTDLIADAKTRLISTSCKYWSAGSQATSSASKNPWINEPNEPFILFISPEQENALIKDSQFVNAAEYGAREVILNGEVGRYLSLKIVVSHNTPASASGGQCLATDWASGTDLDGHMCLLVKAKRACAFCWGQDPDLQVFDYPSEQETRLVLYMEYATDSLYDDAIVKLFVLDV